MRHTKNMVYKPTEESRELFLCATNNSKLYRRMTEHVLDSLEKKIKKGIYDREKAVDAWYYVATAASDQYHKDFGYKFTVTERYTAAVEMAEYYEEQILFYDL